MASPTLPVPRKNTGENYLPSPTEDRAEINNHSETNDGAGFVDEPEHRSRAVRGVVTGILVGAGLWTAILVLVGVIKL